MMKDPLACLGSSVQFLVAMRVMESLFLQSHKGKRSRAHLGTSYQVTTMGVASYHLCYISSVRSKL